MALDTTPAPTLALPGRMSAKEQNDFKTAKAGMVPYQPIWRLALAFFDHHQYAEINAKTARVTELETAEGSEDKPRWVSRATRNRYTSGVLRECAHLTSRAPVWECTPRGADYRQDHLSKLGEQALLYLYEHLELDTKSTGWLVTAANTGAAYVWPYWNSNLGPKLGTGPGNKALFQGEIDFLNLMPDEVLWKPGYEFSKAPVHYVYRAYPVAEVMARPGYIGPAELKPNATAATYEFGNPASSDTKDCIFVIDALERPCEKYPDGRWMTYLETGEQIQPQRKYPRDPMKSQGLPCIHEVAWIRRQHRHRPLGGGEQAVDIQKTRNHTINQIIMWKNLVLNPRLLAPLGSLLEAPQGQPGEVVEYRPVAGHTPEWEQPKEIPSSFFQVIEQCDQDMAELFGTWDMPDTESAQHLQTAIERDRERRALQAKEVARMWSGLGVHLLELMQQGYQEERLLVFQGRNGVERVPNFKGSKVPTMDVRVAPGSVEGRTRASQDALAWQLFQLGAIPLHTTLSALNSGSTQKILDKFELQEAKQAREIEDMLAIPAQPAGDLPDAESAAMMFEAQGMPPEDAAAMAQENFLGALLEVGPQVSEEDDHEIHADVLSTFMITVAFERQPEIVKGVMRAHLASHKQEIERAAMAQVMASTASAEMEGAENAAKPAQEKPEPSRASMASEKEGMT